MFVNTRGLVSQGADQGHEIRNRLQDEVRLLEAVLRLSVRLRQNEESILETVQE